MAKEEQKSLPPVIGVEEVRALLKEKNFNEKYRLIDVNVGDTTKEFYDGGHIENAIFLDTMKCTETTKYFPKNLPDQEKFKEYVGSLGISNKHHLILYDRSPYGFYAAPRMWWIFRLFGHEKVSVMNGGIATWNKSDKILSQTVPNFNKEEFVIKFNESLAKNYEQINQIDKEKKITIVDARGPADYAKVNETDNSPGHLPSAKNVPYGQLFDESTGLLKTKEQIIELFKTNDVDPEKPIVVHCLTGMSAPSLALALCLYKNRKDIPVYYGSWTEYSLKKEEEKAAKK